MKAFTDLYITLDQTTKTNEKVEAMARYFRASTPEDAAWAIYFLSGRKPRQIIPVAKLRAWAAAEAGISDWLFEESYGAVGDLAETIALILPSNDAVSEIPLSVWVERRILPLRGTMREIDEAAQKEAVLQAWKELGPDQRLIWNKIVTGAFRVGVSQQLVVRALAEVSTVGVDVIAHRLMGDWSPTPDFYRWLISGETQESRASQPYPFHLAYQYEGEISSLGAIGQWQAEWKWDGIRAQLIRRNGEIFLWSRGEELVTDRYPEVAQAAAALPDGIVVDGELLPWVDGQVAPFAQLQRRIGRRTIGPKLLREIPVVMLLYDLIEFGGEDWRARPLMERRAKLEAVVAPLPETAARAFPLSPVVRADSWEELMTLRAESRGRRVEGLMLKRLDSPFRVGRHKGDWWKWKVEPFMVDAVMVYAQRGHGKRASLYTDYTFAVWSDSELTPFAKAYSGLTDAEIRQVDRFIRDNTIETFGPVRRVKPELVFELGFEGIQKSSRHKSGFAVRFPRILRWRMDKTPEEADSLATIQAMLESFEHGGEHGGERGGESGGERGVEGGGENGGGR
jgi:DNA ligase-1